jgi:hypothetical protein
VTDATEQLTDQSLDALRTAIARLVPHAMERAVDSYRAFVTVAVPLEAKEFKDHHTAGRTALGHLEALLRLARWAALPAGAEPGAGGQDDDEAVIDTMLADASRALAALREGAGPDDGVGEPA